MTPGIADINNSHPYQLNNRPPWVFFDPRSAINYNATSNNFITATPQGTDYGPYIFSEHGYPFGGGGADLEHAQAAYTLDSIMDCAKVGAEVCYIYQLMDQSDGMGLFVGTTPRPVATAIKNLTTILTDVGAGQAPYTFDPVIVPYRFPNGFPLSGSSPYNSPVDGNSLLLQESDGTYDIVVWREPLLFPNYDSNYVAASAVDVPVTFPTTAVTGKCYVYDPMVGTSSIASCSGNSVTLSMTDHPMIIKVKFSDPPRFLKLTDAGSVDSCSAETSCRSR
jgi:hypothetical protein